jgi:hypothetical protein
MNQETARALSTWAKTESRKLVEAETSKPGSPMETHLIDLWEKQRPDLIAALTPFGAIKHLAHVLVERSGDQEMDLIREGFSPGEAHQIAVTDWWMLDPGETNPFSPDEATIA